MMRTQREKGQSIVEAACGTVIFIMVAVVIAMGGLNIFAFITYDGKAQLVAKAAAKVAAEESWFLGMERPNAGATREAARQQARQAAEAMASALGMPPIVGFELAQDVNGDRILTTATVTFNTFELPFHIGLLPGLSSITRQGMSTSYAYGPMAMLNLEVPTAQGQYRGVQLPGFFTYRQTGDGSIVRDRFGGGGSFNLELGSYFHGFIVDGTVHPVRYFQGFNGPDRSSVPDKAGASHGNLPDTMSFPF